MFFHLCQTSLGLGRTQYSRMAEKKTVITNLHHSSAYCARRIVHAYSLGLDDDQTT